jgi:hypothetical protein
MTHIAIFSLKNKTVEMEISIEDGAKIKDEVEISNGSEHLADLSLADYRSGIYENECTFRGGDWSLYRSDKPFSWAAVTPKNPEETEVSNEKE